MRTRKQQAQQVRNDAAALAANRPYPNHQSNGEEFEYRRRDGKPSHIANFTKGLPHDDNGLLKEPRDYQQFVKAIDSGDPRDFRSIPLGPGNFNPDGSYKDYDLSDPKQPKPIHQWKSGASSSPKVRAWESQGAGNTFDLEGPDAQAVTMPPAPRLDSQELIAEMAEVYWMAILRDKPFANFATDSEIQKAQQSIAQFAWFNASNTNQLESSDLTPEALSRRRILVQTSTEKVPLNKLFRGITKGDDVDPYISQFLLIGNKSLGNDCPFGVEQGRIAYGSITIEQKVRVAVEEEDFLTNWNDWLDVQNGADLRGTERYKCEGEGDNQKPLYRFITTPRDLATYVHYDSY